MANSYSVWAPRAKRVSVKIGDEAHSMSLGERGWWLSDELAAHGVDYGFLLDDDPHPYPDPRSEWQPEGVHGLSRVIDHGLFQWKDAGWRASALADAVIYELHIGTFTRQGTFDAAIERLVYLRNLGVTHIELMPVASFTGGWGWGYDGVALSAPQEQYGGPDGLKRLVDACHAAGLAVVLDVVYNHFGPVGNYTGKFGPYITANHVTPWGGAVNLEEAGSSEVRRFFCDNAMLWLRDYHFDGLRLDAVHAFVDRSAINFLEQLSEETDALAAQLGRPLVLIAESDLNDPRVVTPRDSGGWGVHAQWADDFHHALFSALTGERLRYYSDYGSLEKLAKAFTSPYVYDGTYSAFRERTHGRTAGDLSAHAFVGCIQNHDQIGNRPFGDRLYQMAGAAKSKLGAALMLMAPWVPMIFQGEEFAASAPFLYFADHEDPELASAVSEGRRLEHASDGQAEKIPDPEAPETFLQSHLNWAELDDPQHTEILNWYRKLIALRRAYPDLRDGDASKTLVQFDESARWMTIERGALHIFCNFSDHAIRIAHAYPIIPLLASSAEIDTEPDGVTLPAESIVICQLKAAIGNES